MAARIDGGEGGGQREGAAALGQGGERAAAL